MSLIAVEASIRLKDPSTREAALAESARLQLATRTEEAGCLVYCFAADPCEPDHIQVYELWENEESLAAHFFPPQLSGDARSSGTIRIGVCRKSKNANR